MPVLTEWKRARRKSINNRELLVAVCDNNLEEVNCLLNSGTDINFKDADGCTPLSLAAEYGNYQVVQLLLDKGASMKTEDFNHETPLDIANRLNRSEIVKILGISTNQTLQSETSDADETSKPSQIQKQNGLQISLDSNENGILDDAEDEYAHQVTLTEFAQEFFKHNYIKHNNGSALLAEGKYEEALKEFQLSYEEHKKLHGPYDENTLMSKSNIASVLLNLGRIDESFECYQEVLTDCTTHLEENHHHTLSTKSNIAHCLIKQGKYEEGLSMAQTVYAKQKVVLGKHHEETLITKNNIASALESLNKHDEALKIHEEIYDYKKNNLAENHQSTLETRSNIASILSKQGNLSAALEIYKDILENYRKMYNENHPLTLKIRGYIASILCDQGNRIAALKIFKDLLKSHQEIFGENHPETLEIQTKMAYALRESNKLQEASKSFQEILVKQKNTLGLDHPSIERSLSGLASVFQRQGKATESLKAHQELLQCQVSLFGVKDIRILDTRKIIAKILIDDKKYDDALKHYSEIYEIQKDLFGVNALQTCSSKMQMASIHLLENQVDKFLNIMKEIMEAQSAEFGHNNPVNNAICSNLTEFLQKTQPEVSNQTITDPIEAVQKNDLNVLKDLIEEGADVNTKDSSNNTLLHHAVNVGFMNVISFLLNSGADITCTSIKGNTPLHTAISRGNFQVVQVLLENVERDKLREFIDFKTFKTGSAALHIAAKNGFLEITRYLLSRGAKYDLKNNDDHLPIDLAMDQYVKDMLKNVSKLFEYVNADDKELVSLLKKHTVDDYLAVVNARDNQGYNLMQVAVSRNDRQLVDLFHDLRSKRFLSIYSAAILDKNLHEFFSLANVTFNTTQAKELGLDEILTAARKLVQMFRSQHKCALNPNVDSIEDMIELLESSTGTPTFVELAADVIAYHSKRFITAIQSTMLLMATKSNNLTKVEKLVHEGISVNVKDNGGWTPLHYATNVNNEKMVEVLLAKGAQVNCVTNTDKFTPLHIAVQKENIDIVKLLLHSHSSIEFIDATTEAKGLTALHIAADKEYPFIVQILFAHRANYQVKNKYGQTPMDVVVKAKINFAGKFFKLVDQLFVDVKKGNVKVIEKLKGLNSASFVMAVRVRNSDGCNLMEVAASNKHYDIADKIYQIIEIKYMITDYSNTLRDLGLL